MTQTRSGYRAIDDTEVDPDSPVTQTLMEGLRDQPYGMYSDGTGALDAERVLTPERLKTTSSDVRDILHPTGSGGNLELASIGNLTGGTMGTGNASVSSVKTVTVDINISNSDDTDYRVLMSFKWALSLSGYTEVGSVQAWRPSASLGMNMTASMWSGGSDTVFRQFQGTGGIDNDTYWTSLVGYNATQSPQIKINQQATKISFTFQHAGGSAANWTQADFCALAQIL